MDKADFNHWLDRYVDAWKSYDPQAIGDLFTEDATYQYHPWQEPTRGREAIIKDWLENPDPPGSWSAHYEPFAVDGDRAVAVGRSIYYASDRSTVEREYYNAWLMRFDANGRCKEFSEYYMQTPKKEAR